MVEGDIFAALSPLFSGRVYPDEAPAGVVLPYCVYQQAGGESPTFLERASPSKKNGRFQIAVWSLTRAEASNKCRAVEAAMVTAAAFQAQPIGDQVATKDEETKYRGALQDFSVWSDR